MKILSTKMKIKGSKERILEVIFNGESFSVVDSYGLVTFTTKYTKFDEALQEYNRIIRAYFWNIEQLYTL